MDYLNGDVVWEEQGTFVYELLKDITVRTHPAVGEQYQTATSFHKGELVAVDLVRPAQDDQNGPYLRLSDGCGWLFEKQDSEDVMFRVGIDKALWVFYVDNIPNGQALSRHPADRTELMVKEANYPPMRKIYCDRRAIGQGQNFYRVQGTKGWIVDKSVTNSRINSGYATISMLLPESNVRTGLFAFRCRSRIAVRMHADEFETPTVIDKGQMVVADIVREPLDRGDTSNNTSLTSFASHTSNASSDEDVYIENEMYPRCSSSNTDRDGPYLRLTDGLGWLFKSKSGGSVLEEILLETGTWKLQCVSSTPVGLWRQPIDRQDMLYQHNLFKSKDEIECDVKIPDSNGITYYRVKGTNGYIFDRRDGKPLFQVMYQPGKPALDKTSSIRDQKRWTPDFVRGIASLVDRVEEIQHDKHAKILSFSTPANIEAKVNVYYTTRIVGTASFNCRSTLGNTQVFRRDCTPADVADILRTPLMAKSTTSSSEEPPVATIFAPRCHDGVGGYVLGEEEEQMLRQELIDCYVKSESLKQQQLVILRTLKACDDKRAMSERRTAELKEKRKEELRKKEAERMKLREQTRKGCVCEDCGVVFKDSRAQHKHWSIVHGLKCKICGRIVTSVQELAEHQDDLHSSAGAVVVRIAVDM